MTTHNPDLSQLTFGEAINQTSGLQYGDQIIVIGRQALVAELQVLDWYNPRAEQQQTPQGPRNPTAPFAAHYHLLCRRAGHEAILPLGLRSNAVGGPAAIFAHRRNGQEISNWAEVVTASTALKVGHTTLHLLPPDQLLPLSQDPAAARMIDSQGNLA